MKLIASLAATAALTTTAGAAGAFDYIFTAQYLNHVISLGAPEDGDPITSHKDNQLSNLTTGASLSYTLSEPGVEYASSYTSTFGATLLTVDVAQNITVTIPGLPLGSSGLDLEFRVTDTTAFEATGSLAMLTTGVGDNRWSLREAGGPTLINFASVYDGSANPFSFSGVLDAGKTYLLQFGVGADGNRTSSGTLSFALTAGAIPEPETYAVLAGLALAGFWVIRRRQTVSGSSQR